MASGVGKCIIALLADEAMLAGLFKWAWQVCCCSVLLVFTGWPAAPDRPTTRFKLDNRYALSAFSPMVVCVEGRKDTQGAQQAPQAHSVKDGSNGGTGAKDAMHACAQG